MWSARKKVHVMIGLLGLLAGCGIPMLQLTVTADGDVNQQRTFYMLVRTVDSKQYLTESYAAVAAQVVTPDASVLASAILPSRTPVPLKIPITDAKPLAIYFLFTTPAGDWKTLLEPPLPKHLMIALGPGRIAKIERRGTLKSQATAGTPKLKAPKLKAPKLK